MVNDNNFSLLCGLLCLGYFLYQLAQIVIWRKKTEKVSALIIGVSSAMPETVRRNNSKWADVSYQLGGKTWHASRKVQVPMSAAVGSRVWIRCFRDEPQKVAVFSGLRLAVAGGLAVVFWLASL